MLIPIFYKIHKYRWDCQIRLAKKEPLNIDMEENAYLNFVCNGLPVLQSTNFPMIIFKTPNFGRFNVQDLILSSFLR